MEIDKLAKAVKNKDSFLLFMEALIQDYQKNNQDWENKTIPDFLEALQACIEDMDGFYAYRNIELPQNIPWFIFSNALMSARIYE